MLSIEVEIETSPSEEHTIKPGDQTVRNTSHSYFILEGEVTGQGGLLGTELTGVREELIQAK